MELTAKEKAKELVNTFLESLYNNGSFSFKKILYAKAKQCALIAVDEILDIVQYNGVKEYAYWNKVKQEIEKL